MKPNEIARSSLDACYSADSPEKFCDALENLLSALASNADEGANECAGNWKDLGAGKPWVKISKKLDGMVLSARLLKATLYR